MTLDELFEAKNAAVAAVLPIRGKLLEGYGTIGHSQKIDTSVVTELDLWAEKEIKAALKDFDPTIGYLGEEHGAEGDVNKRWLIDPIDGTEQFIRGIPFCSTMVCLVEGKDVLVSVIHNIATGELYWAVKGSGAWLGDQRLSISSRPLSRSFVEVSIDRHNDENLKLYNELTDTTKAVIRMYCSAMTWSLLASGRTEGRIVSGVRGGGPWDYAPGFLLVVEAGGQMMHLDGTPYDYLKHTDIIAGTKEFVDKVRGFVG